MKKIVVSVDLSKENLSDPNPAKAIVDRGCELIYCVKFGNNSFAEYVNVLAENYVTDRKIVIYPSATCSKCETYQTYTKTNPEV
ncbi:hypothetical protein Dtox_3641 [Desulfofarcimen acetoxidans DSM 771]|jgi:hypothetical protein|uniref:Uncharacterized protein n=1 Tax=Desulfofarcimen acetoxidans (strain ATCC 49208 / DSM 771 / KCTC 5769 / VKM B-1644 / 5575) TaxID=485916 RepID=C8VWI8_DESAS|nr:hypothetical protein [Desulfofarcimen acetoxidans]ACV64352.1 hypothetical protein Dtox_3641 [Desulfofarcimen acetoxidans DSM 771]